MLSHRLMCAATRLAPKTLLFAPFHTPQVRQLRALMRCVHEATGVAANETEAAMADLRRRAAFERGLWHDGGWERLPAAARAACAGHVQDRDRRGHTCSLLTSACAAARSPRHGLAAAAAHVTCTCTCTCGAGSARGPQAF